MTLSKTTPRMLNEEPTLDFGRSDEPDWKSRPASPDILDAVRFYVCPVWLGAGGSSFSDVVVQLAVLGFNLNKVVRELAKREKRELVG